MQHVCLQWEESASKYLKKRTVSKTSLAVTKISPTVYRKAPPAPTGFHCLLLIEGGLEHAMESRVKGVAHEFASGTTPLSDLHHPLGPGRHAHRKTLKREMASCPASFSTFQPPVTGCHSKILPSLPPVRSKPVLCGLKSNAKPSPE